MIRQSSCDAARHRYQQPSQGGQIVATLCAMMALGTFCGKEATAFLGPARNGLSEQLVVTPGGATAASARFAAVSSLPRPRTIEGPQAGTLATQVFWAFALFAGACSVRKMAASRSALQHKLRSCTVACQAVELPTPVVFQPCTSVVEELKPTPAAIAPPPLPAQITEQRTVALRATMVRGARCTTTARSAARRARQLKTADRTAASRAARRAVGSRLQATSCHQEVPPLTFDASRQRLKIQAGLQLADRAHSGHVHEIKLSSGNAEKLNGLFSAAFYMIEDLHRFKELDT